MRGRFLALSLIAVAAVSGCGSDSDAGPAASGSPPPAASASAHPTATVDGAALTCNQLLVDFDCYATTEGTPEVLGVAFDRYAQNVGAFLKAEALDGVLIADDATGKGIKRKDVVSIGLDACYRATQEKPTRTTFVDGISQNAPLDEWGVKPEAVGLVYDAAHAELCPA